jgi:hypothetical protein
MTSKLGNTATLKSFVKQNSYSNKNWQSMSMVFTVPNIICPECNGSGVASIKQNTNFNLHHYECSYFWFLTKMASLIVVHPLKISMQHFMVPRWLVKVLHPTQKFEHPPFRNGRSYGIKSYGVEITFNSVASLLNLIKSTNVFRNY